MKKPVKAVSALLLILSLFVSTQLVSSDPSYPTEKTPTSNPFQKAWNHKKKIIAVIAVAVISLTLFRAYKTPVKWNTLKHDLIKARRKLDDVDLAIKAANDFADFTFFSWFTSPDQRKYVIKFAKAHPKLFTSWRVIKAQGTNQYSLKKFEKIYLIERNWLIF